MKSTIRLFRALPIKVKSIAKSVPDIELLKKTIPRGFIFSSDVVDNYSNFDDLIKLIEKEVGLTPEQLNSSFHKSWQKVRDASIEQLFIEQIIHYITTYGFEKLGIYDKDSVYIPHEALEIPEITEDIKLVIIKGYTKEELKEKLLEMLGSGIALGEDTIKDVMDVAVFVDLDIEDIDKVKNKEVLVQLCEYLNIIPANPVEFLRYVLYRTINKTLLIKNAGTIEEIKQEITNKFGIVKLFKKYESEVGYNRLGEIFYRFKPLFLALKENGRMKPIVNKIRKLAIKYHKPMAEDYLNTITAKLITDKVSRIKLELELNKVNTFRKIRLAYALKYRTKDVDSILYKIRNGKGYATEFNFDEQLRAKKVLDIVLESIVKDVSKNVKGKKIYIPEYINYTLPATEKQFTDNFPNGTYVSIPKDMVFGIHWDNLPSHRIDLDLSLISPSAGKIGWDSGYRTADRGILFSGDITDAQLPNGASELFYVKKQADEAAILFVNYFNYEENVEVPFKIIVAQEHMTDFKTNYMVDPNKVISIAKSKINERQKILGLLITTPEECRFYFTETNLGCSITSSSNEFTENSRKYLFNFYEDAITLNDILINAGAELVDKEDCEIDLSPENLEKDTILKLLK